MGNAESTPLEEITKPELVRRVSDMGVKYEKYAKALDENGVDGSLLARMDEDEFEETLDDLGVNSRLHRRILAHEFLKSLSVSPDDESSTGSTWSESDQFLQPPRPISEVRILRADDRSTDSSIFDEMDPSGSERRSSQLSRDIHGKDTFSHVSRDSKNTKATVSTQFSRGTSANDNFSQVSRDSKSSKGNLSTQLSRDIHGRETFSHAPRDPKSDGSLSTQLSRGIDGKERRVPPVPSNSSVKDSQKARASQQPFTSDAMEHRSSLQSLDSQGSPRDSRDIDRLLSHPECEVLTKATEGHVFPEENANKHTLPSYSRPPVCEDDMERVAQIQAYGLDGIKPGSEIAKVLTGYLEMASKLFSFDHGAITFYHNESQLSYTRAAVNGKDREALLGREYVPLNAGPENKAFLGKVDHSNDLCYYPSLSERTFIVKDVEKEKAYQWMSAVSPFRCFVSASIVAPSGLALGTLRLHNYKPRHDFGSAQEVQLEQICRMVAQAIENWYLKTSISRLHNERQKLVQSTNENKTTPPTDQPVFVLTDIEGSTILWEKAPEAMKKALDLHDDLIRKTSSKYFGYEVTTEGDSFLLAFHDAVDAFGFCLEFQEALYKAPWSKEILEQELASEADNGFRGLRVRMGVNSGPVSAETNQVTGRLEYAGATVDLTRAIEAMGSGGQVLATADTWDAVSFLAETRLGSPQVVDLGSHILCRGTKISDGVVAKRILQVVPTSLAVKYNSLSDDESSSGRSPGGISKGREFPELKTVKKLSKSFFDAPRGDKVTIAFIGTKEIDAKYKESADLVSEVIGHASSLLPGTEGYQCQDNMLAFPNVTEAANFGLKFMNLLKEQKPFEDGTNMSKLVTFGCVHDTYVSVEPHKTTGRADYFGKVVNRAARVTYTAKPGRVCVGVAVNGPVKKEEFVLDDATIKLKFTGTKQLKGVEENMAVYMARRERGVKENVMAWFGYSLEE